MVSDQANKLSTAIKKNSFVSSKSFDDEPEKNLKLIGIFSWNWEEWVLTDIACMWNSIASIPFYDTLGVGSIEFIANETEISTIFVSGEKLSNLISILNEIPHL